MVCRYLTFALLLGGCAGPDLPPPWSSPGLGPVATRVYREPDLSGSLSGELGPGHRGHIAADIFSETGGRVESVTAWAFLPLGTTPAAAVEALEHRCGEIPSEAPCFVLSNGTEAVFDVRDDVESLLGGEVLVRFASSTVGSAQACLLRRLSGATVQGEDQCAFGSTLVRFGPMEELFKEAQEQGVEVGLSEEEELDAIPTRVNLVPRVSSARFSGPAQPDVQALEGAGGRVRVVAEERLRIDFDLVDVDEALWRFQGGRFVDDGDEHELAVFIYGDPAEVESEEAAVSIVMHPKSELVLVAVVRDGAGNASSMWFEVEAG